MKQYRSEIENSWIEFIPVNITAEQQKIIHLPRTLETEESKIEKEIVLAEINSKRQSPVIKSKSLELNAIYDSVKPTLSEEDVYEFISIDVFDIDGIFSGILNTRINSEHKQIRF